jgi:hypothetical protein
LVKDGYNAAFDISEITLCISIPDLAIQVASFIIRAAHSIDQSVCFSHDFLLSSKNHKPCVEG